MLNGVNEKTTPRGGFLLPLDAIWRRGPESNRPGRICSPLHNRFATAPYSAAVYSIPNEQRYSNKKGSGCFPLVWSGRRVSNSRPQPWQGCALPTELLPRNLLSDPNITRIIRIRNRRGFFTTYPGAGDESRTRDLNLGKVALYQLSYSRIFLLLSRRFELCSATRNEIMKRSFQSVKHEIQNLFPSSRVAFCRSCRTYSKHTAPPCAHDV
jgi:hypothetical protein